MDVRELIGKLAGSAISPGHVPGGKPALTAVDISASLTGLRKGETALMRVKYALDESSLPALHEAAREAACNMAEHQRWRRDAEFQRRIAVLAELASEHVVLPNLCRRCSGRGELSSRKGVVILCLSCCGMGTREAPDAVRAKRMGLDRSSYTRTWESRLRGLIFVLQHWEADAVRSVRRHMRWH